ncbi:MAG TPA: hypothetical protein VD838_22560 [Anaeromyxobacteraceae bacterium]|nr:hypothetical protein [Anaeromyxobacteraceae bacterium]
MTTNRWMIAAAFGLAFAACSTTKESQTTASGEAGRQPQEEEATVAQADDERQEAEPDPQDEAAEQAPSTRASSGAGSLDPHPLPTENEEGEEAYTGTEPQQQGQQGRVPPSRQADAGTAGMDASASAGGTAAAGTEVSGRVALVDEDNREIAIDAGGVTTQVKVAEDAQILVNGERASLDDLRQGQEVRASMNQGADVPEATRVEVKSKNK